MTRALRYRLDRLEIARHNQVLGVRYAVSSQPPIDGDYPAISSASDDYRDMTEDEWVREYCKP